MDILQYAAQEQTLHKNLIQQNKEKKPQITKTYLVPKDVQLQIIGQFSYWRRTQMVFKFKGQFYPNRIIFTELWFYNTGGFYDERGDIKD